MTTKNKTTVRSIRIPEEVWRRASARATEEGVTASFVVTMMLTGYADGDLDLPTVKLVWDNDDEPTQWGN